jgi:hypothetical protein
MDRTTSAVYIEQKAVSVHTFALSDYLRTFSLPISAVSLQVGIVLYCTNLTKSQLGMNISIPTSRFSCPENKQCTIVDTVIDARLTGGHMQKVRPERLNKLEGTAAK